MRRALATCRRSSRSTGDVVVRPFVAGADEEAFLALNAEAFAHHPEQGRMTRADLDQRMAEPWFDPAGFFLAGAGRRDCSASTGPRCTRRAARARCTSSGSSPRAQGGGLGRLLTLTGLQHLASRGLDEVLLYVESDNAPAVAVYWRLGFTHAAADTHVQYARR